MAHILEFTAAGSLKVLARAIEEHAQRRQALQAIVVPWESGPQALSMAVTFVRVDGWAIEHTNLGTIRLDDLGGERTRVTVLGDDPDHPDRDRLVAQLEGFARQLQARLQSGSGDGA
jgi:hypothetical protein